MDNPSQQKRESQQLGDFISSKQTFAGLRLLLLISFFSRALRYLYVLLPGLPSLDESMHMQFLPPAGVETQDTKHKAEVTFYTGGKEK